MNDPKNEIENFCELNQLIFFQYVYREKDSKSFVDKPYRESQEKTSDNFKIFLNEMREELGDLLSSISEKETKKYGFYEWALYYKEIIKKINIKVQNERMSGSKNLEKEIISSESDEDISKGEKTNKTDLPSRENPLHTNFPPFDDIRKRCDKFLVENYAAEENDFDEAGKRKNGIEGMSEEAKKLYEELKDDNLKSLLIELNNVWEDLYKIMKSKKENKKSTLIYLKHPFTVPGGRFREIYYWDSYWITDGQLVLGMYDKVEACILNFIDLIKTFEYIPNGTRVYYRNRSQPPMFAQIVFNFYKRNREVFKIKFDDKKSELLNALEKEYQFWEEKRKINFKYEDKDYELNYYCVETDFPRPESLKEDIDMYEEYIKNEKDSVKDQNELYSNIKSAAESGWDFSTRFFKDYKNMYTICTKDIIPVDLNAILWKNEMIMSELCEEYFSEPQKSIIYKEKADKRKEIINEVLWKDNCWYDFDYKAGKHRDNFFYFSNIMPMIYGIMKDNYSYDKILELYKEQLFGYDGGIPASDNQDGTQQWDFPNVWAPHQALLVEFLMEKKEEKLALCVANSFYKSVERNFIKGADNKIIYRFFEKYHCISTDKVGYGGEYPVQEGFGWTNGVLLKFIEYFKEDLTKTPLKPCLDEKIPLKNIDEYEENQKDMVETSVKA